MKITIIDDSRAEKCEEQCGTDWSSTEAIALANRRIAERFGKGMKLEYIDLSSLPSSSRALELKQTYQKMSLPLLLVNGHPRISGQFDMRQLLDSIEAELEVRHE